MQPGPNFFLAGAAKGGTTSLYHYLRLHPEIFLSPVKEPNYFCTDINPELLRPKLKAGYMALNTEAYLRGPMKNPIHVAYIRNEADYLRLFSNAANAKAIGECSVSYMISGSAPENIYKFNPHSKIIFILRHPVERAFSHYLMEKRLTLTNRSFADDLQVDLKSPVRQWGATPLYIELGLYYRTIRKWMDVFGPGQIHVLLQDDLYSNPARTLQDVFHFLGVDESILPEKIQHHNASQLPRNAVFRALMSNPSWKVRMRNTLDRFGMKKTIKRMMMTRSHGEKLDPATAASLMQYFSADIEQLAILINRDLHGWLVRYETSAHKAVDFSHI